MELRMSLKERDRLRVMDQLSCGQMAQWEAAQRLSLSSRQVRRLLRRYEAHGDAGLVHRARGKASNRQIAAEVRQHAQRLLRSKYRDFGPMLASEHLASDEGIVVSRETVRKWMQEEHLWGNQRRKRPHRARRPRRACFGELVQMDTSDHDWLEGRGEPCVLITMIDDAMGMKFMRFFPGDTTMANMEMIKSWIEEFGRPVALYTDWASHFKQTPKRGQKQRLKPTQIERALNELHIGLIAAHSPQAKGRVERSHGTDQDRLVKELRLAGVNSIAKANRFLDRTYLPQINRRFAKQPANGLDAHRPLAGEDLAAIFSIQETRRVMNDYTVQIDGVAWQIERGEILGGLSATTVTVERRIDGTMRLRLGDRYLAYHRAKTHCTIPSNRRPRKFRKKSIDEVGASAFREGSLRSPSLHSETPTSSGKPKPKNKPAPDHPWRRTFLLCRKADTSTLR